VTKTLKRSPDITFINPEVPSFDLPQLNGARYTAVVPDTLDLADRAAHAIHGMTATTDPEANCEIFWRVCFGWKPAAMYHDWNDHVEFKYYAPVPLLRLMCDSDEALDVERHWMTNLLQMQGPDGLLYTPLSGRPWGRIFGSGGEMYETELGEQTADLQMLGRSLEAAAVYHDLTGDDRWKELGHNAVRGVRRFFVDQGDFAYLPATLVQPGQEVIDEGIPPPVLNHCMLWLGHGLVIYHRMTGMEEALELGYKLARFFFLGHSGWVGPEGEFWGFPDGKTNEKQMDLVHFHTNTLVRMLMLDAGIARDDREMIELAQKGYEYGKHNGESETLMGYFPENLGPPENRWSRKTIEVCELADMIYLGLRQSRTGLADCWDDIDCWVRNMFAEMQLLETDWIDDFSNEHGTPMKPPFAPPHNTTDRVPERCHGTWGGWGAPNDWQGDPVLSIMACCVGNASMQLYRLWRDMIQFDPEKQRLTVHLLLNRASAWADIHSHIPNQGRVEVELKRDCELALRLPGYAEAEQFEVSVDGGNCESERHGRYVHVRGRKSQTVVLEFLISEHAKTIRVVDKDYKVVVRGNTIVDIDPPGTHHPMFQRPHYRNDEAGRRTVDRFVSDRIVECY
jgi:hypothetical protein